MFPPGFDPEPEKDTTGTTGEIWISSKSWVIVLYQCYFLILIIVVCLCKKLTQRIWVKAIQEFYAQILQLKSEIILILEVKII